MIISLTGFMGCGKSSVGRRLSELLCCPFIDLDAEIEARAGRSIADIFASDGEAEFRRIEKDTLSDIIGQPATSIDPRRSATPPSRGWHVNSGHQAVPDNVRHINTELVLALGGGAVMTDGSADIVHEGTMCIYLKAAVDTLLDHLTGETSGRPLLNDSSVGASADTDSNLVTLSNTQTSALKGRILELMSLRAETYERTAHHIIDTDNRTVNDIALEIISQLR